MPPQAPAKVTLFPSLQRGRRRRVVADDRVEPTARQRLPQALALAAPRGWVGRTCIPWRRPESLPPRTPDSADRSPPSAGHRRRAPRRSRSTSRPTDDVDDVHSEPRLARELDEESRPLPSPRPRAGWRATRRRTGDRLPPASSFRHAGPLGVHHEGRVECSRAPGQPLEVAAGGIGGNSSTPDGQRKHLKANTPAACSALELTERCRERRRRGNRRPRHSAPVPPRAWRRAPPRSWSEECC